jgi:hypothetical protein
MPEATNRPAITFDTVGTCTATPTRVVEGYAPADGYAHGHLAVVVDACDGCHEAVRALVEGAGLLPYSCQPMTREGRCGERATFGR